MPVTGTLLKEIWARESRWILCYCAGVDDYVMELMEGQDDNKIVRASTIDEAVRKVWMEYFGLEKEV